MCFTLIRRYSIYCLNALQCVRLKRLAFSVVEYYVRNNWSKHGLKRIMMNDKGFFFFKFDTRDDLEAVLEGGPWMIRNSPVILKKWTMGSRLLKDELTQVPMWVKFHDVPLQVFEEDGISLIASFIGKPVMLDSYTSAMCKDSWGRIPKGVPVAKGFQDGKEFSYQPRAPSASSKDGGARGEGSSRLSPSTHSTDGTSDALKDNLNVSRKDKDVVDMGAMKMSNISTPNPFTVLGEDEEEEVENIWDESVNLNIQQTGGSTPANMVPDVYRWKWTSNGSLCSKGSRIILGWNDDLVDVIIMAQTNQVMHVQSNPFGHAGLMRLRPWFILGDFNATLNLEDHLAGGYESNTAMRKFKECVQAMEVADVNCTGLYFTWNQKPKGSNGILKKIDRIMCNLQFNDEFPWSFAIFQPYHILDHSPCVLRIPTLSKPKPKPFKFSKFLVYKEGFRDIVETGWNINVEGFAMFHFVKRLKGMKTPFLKLLHNHGHLYERVNRIRIELDEAQKAIDQDPSSSILREEHAHYLLDFKEAQLDEERFLKQKAKIEWLQAGDSNTAYFHRIVKSKCARNRIKMVSYASNNLFDGNQVPDAFVNHYTQFLRAEGVTIPLEDHDLYTHVLDGAKADFMVRDVFDDEHGMWWVAISLVLFETFSPNGKLLKELNHTIISLIPKVTTPLMRNYHKRRGPPRCVFKVDIQTTYDTVDWSFLETILVGFGFHLKMVQWIMVCVSGASYSICVNGNLHGWFKDDFQYHHLCDQQRIINLCFADLFLFSCGNPSSVVVLMEALEEFKHVSGLVPSIPKSMTFFCNVPNAIKASILNSMPFAEGVLPVRYLGVPLISSRLLYHDCKILIEKLESRVNDWRNKFLSLAGSLQLIQSVLGDVSWGWRKLLQIRSTIRPFIWHKINNGKSTSAWFDRWADLCPLKDMFSIRDIARSGFSLDDSVNNLISDGVWQWPLDWLSRNGVLRPFSVACAWDTIRTRAVIVNWNNIVWFPHCIPRYAIHLWLVFQQKLKTQDRLWQWDVSPSIDLNLLRCPLCDLVPDSYDHLFFECAFSLKVWSKVRVLCGMDTIPPWLIDITSFINPISKGKIEISYLS
ncbi:sodium/hydrogen exchanger 6 [Tanacetum coccineum]